MRTFPWICVLVTSHHIPSSSTPSPRGGMYVGLTVGHECSNKCVAVCLREISVSFWLRLPLPSSPGQKCSQATATVRKMPVKTKKGINAAMMFLPQRNNEINWAWWWHFWYSAFVRLPSSTTISCKLVVKSGEFIDSYTVDSSRDETMENPEVFSPFLWEMHGRRRRILFTTSYIAGREGGREGGPISSLSPNLPWAPKKVGRREKSNNLPNVSSSPSFLFFFFRIT